MSTVNIIIELDDGSTVAGTCGGPDLSRNLQAAMQSVVTGINVRNAEPPKDVEPLVPVDDDGNPVPPPTTTPAQRRKARAAANKAQ